MKFIKHILAGTVALMAFAGTYIGSAIIAEVLLKLTHVI